MLKLKLQYFGHLMQRSSNSLATWCEELTHWKRPWCWERLKTGGEGDDMMRMVGWHPQLDEHEFEQALIVGDGQGNLACCSPWGRKDSDTTEQLNWTDGSLLFLEFLVAFVFLLIMFICITFSYYLENQREWYIIWECLSVTYTYSDNFFLNQSFLLF